MKLIRSTAPNPDFKIGVKSAAQLSSNPVMKPDGGSTEKKVELLRQEIIPILPKIAAPAMLNVLFNHHLDLLAGLIKPADFYRLLRDWVESRKPAASGRF